MEITKIYTDGACSGNQSQENLGGWGTVLEYKDHSKELFGGEINTTNNRMEMLALIEGLKALKKPHLNIDVFSDSSYLIECFRQKWYLRWKANGWINTKKKAVENRDLWEELLGLTEGHNINYFRVKGHVNLDHPKTDLAGLYEKFVEWNGSSFSFEAFKYITEKNNRADTLANMGIDSLKDVDPLENLQDQSSHVV